MTTPPTNQLPSDQLASTRDGFGKAMVALAEKDPSVVALCADLTESLRLHWLRDSHPNQFIEMGVAEQNMVGVAAGLALAGLTPFAASYAVFNPGRTWDQIRVSVCYPNLNVKLVGGHTGVTVGPDGATHQALEDIALTRVLPNMTVVVPCDGYQAFQATLAIAAHRGPCYLRLSRENSPDLRSLYTNQPFVIGKAQLLRDGTDVTLIACGQMVAAALTAAELLTQKGVSAQVINMHTIKPLDVDTIMAAAKKTGKLVTIEEHQRAGGLGSAVAEVVSEKYPVPVLRIGVTDSFGQSGTAAELMEKFGLTGSAISHYILASKLV